MANIQVTQSLNVAYDNTHTRIYQVGEIHQIGTELMPQWLADNAVATGWGVTTASAPTGIIDPVDATETVSAHQPDVPINFTPDGL